MVPIQELTEEEVLERLCKILKDVSVVPHQVKEYTAEKPPPSHLGWNFDDLPPLLTENNPVGAGGDESQAGISGTIPRGPRSASKRARVDDSSTSASAAKKLRQPGARTSIQSTGGNMVELLEEEEEDDSATLVAHRRRGSSQGSGGTTVPVLLALTQVIADAFQQSPRLSASLGINPLPLTGS